MAQEGFLYEENAYKALQKYKISIGGTAGASHDKPDLTITRPGKRTAGCELKNQPTAAGSLVLQYYDEEWHFGPTGDNPEKEFIRDIGMKMNALKIMNDKKKVPCLQYIDGKKTYVGVKTYRDGYQRDLKSFGDTYIDVPNKIISDYYNTKKCYYLNVGTHGFFLLNGSDPLSLQSVLRKKNLQSIPDFSSATSAKTQIRIRVQDKSGGYQFTFSFQFGSVMKSPYNLAPLKSGSSSTIDTIALQKNPILQAWM